MHAGTMLQTICIRKQSVSNQTNSFLHKHHHHTHGQCLAQGPMVPWAHVNRKGKRLISRHLGPRARVCILLHQTSPKAPWPQKTVLASRWALLGAAPSVDRDATFKQGPAVHTGGATRGPRNACAGGPGAARIANSHSMDSSELQHLRQQLAERTEKLQELSRKRNKDVETQPNLREPRS